MRSLVEVLPDEPVTPMTVSPPVGQARPPPCRASSASAASTAAPEPSVSPASATDRRVLRPRDRRDDHRGHVDLAGGQHGHRTVASTAAAAKSWPSTRSPGTATNRPPARDLARVELDGAGDHGRAVGVVQPCRRPTWAISAEASAGSSRRHLALRSRMAAASSSRSENGWTTPADLLAGLVALARDAARCRRPARGGPPATIAARRSPISRTSPRRSRGTRRGHPPASRHGSPPGPRCAGCRR